MNVPAPSQPAAEPKNGDFVAYIAELERRQMAAMQPPLAPASPKGVDSAPLTAEQAQALRARAPEPKAFVGAALLALFGLFLLLQGLLSDGGPIAALVGAFLLWRAWVALRKLLSSAAVPPDAAARLAGLLRNAQKRSRR
jgi:hypothetical protein